MAESQVHNAEVTSIALAADGKFLATFAGRSICFGTRPHSLRFAQSSGTAKMFDRSLSPQIAAILRREEKLGTSPSVISTTSFRTRMVLSV